MGMRARPYSMSIGKLFIMVRIAHPTINLIPQGGEGENERNF